MDIFRKCQSRHPVYQFRSTEADMQHMLKRLEEIRSMPLEETEIPELTAKQRERIKAYELRARNRIARGRLV